MQIEPVMQRNGIVAELAVKSREAIALEIPCVSPRSLAVMCPSIVVLDFCRRPALWVARIRQRKLQYASHPAGRRGHLPDLSTVKDGDVVCLVTSFVVGRPREPITACIEDRGLRPRAVAGHSFQVLLQLCRQLQLEVQASTEVEHGFTIVKVAQVTSHIEGSACDAWCE